MGEAFGRIGWAQHRRITPKRGHSRDALVAANPRNLVGHRLAASAPRRARADAKRLLDVLDWTTAADQQAILVDNPARLYGFADA